MLQKIVLGVSRVNEYSSILTPWIVIPSIDREGRVDWRPALVLSLTYALVEPAATWLLHWSGVHPWIWTLTLTPLLWCAALCPNIWDTESQLREELNREKCDDEQEMPPHTSRRDRVASIASLLPSVTAAALLNASLLLFGQSLYASWIQQRHHITNFFGPYGLALNLLARGSECTIYKRRRRPSTLAQFSHVSLYLSTLVCLVALFVARIMVRERLGIEPFLPFTSLSPEMANARYPE